MKLKLILIFSLFFSALIINLPSVSIAQNENVENSTADDQINLILDDESKLSQELFGPNISKGLYKVLIDSFEESGEWKIVMPSENGIGISRRILGAPLQLSKKGSEELKSVPKNEENNIKKPPRIRKDDGTYETKYFLPYKDERKYVLGARIDFQRRGYHRFTLHPYRPISLNGLVKSFELWVSGRQKNHKLSIIVQDIYGKDFLIFLGKLSFIGWKKLSVNVPDQIVQYDYKISSKRGLIFKGFLVECNPLETSGKYYVYFDNFSAEISRFWEEYKDQRDPVDNW